jgi:hypothetical protein
MGSGETVIVLMALLIPLVCLGAGALLIFFLIANSKQRAQAARGLVTEQHAAALLARQKQDSSVTHPLDLPGSPQVNGLCSFRYQHQSGRHEVSFTLANAQEQPSVHAGAVWMEVKPVAGFVVAELGTSTLRIALDDTRFTYTLDGQVIGHSRFSYPGILGNEVHPENVFLDPAGKPVFTVTRGQSRQETYQLLDPRQVELAQVKLGKTFRMVHGTSTGRTGSALLKRLDDLKQEGTTGAWVRFSEERLDPRTKALILGHFLKEKLFTYSVT